MRMYAHFLGYSAAEGGVVEIFTQDTFSMGSLDVLTGEREFNDFEFTVPYSNIFETYPENNESFTLLYPMTGGTSSIEVERFNAFLAEGSRSLVVGDKLWIENERIEVAADDYEIDGETGLFFLATRGLNGSRCTSHWLNMHYDSESNVIITTNRLRPTGLIVKIYDSNGKVYVYGQITECTISNSSSVTVKCQNLYSQLDNTMIVKTGGRYNDLRACVWFGYNDFSTLFNYQSLPIDGAFKAEPIENQNYQTVDNVKGALEQLLSINNCFLWFDNASGNYAIRQMRRLVGIEEPVSMLIGDVVTVNDGIIESSTFPHVANCTIKYPDGTERSISSFDSNYTSAYTQGVGVTIDMSSIVTYQQNDYDSIAKNKLFFYASILEKLDISASRYSDMFTVGGFYRFLDIYKHKTFYSNINDNVFLCTGRDETKVSFIRVLSFSSSLVAPAIMVKKTGEYTFSLLDDSDEDFFAYLATDSTSLLTARNLITGTIFFEIDDEITLFDADGGTHRPIIGDIDSNNVYTATDVGVIGKYYMMSIESGKSFSALQTKNKAYIYEGEGVL